MIRIRTVTYNMPRDFGSLELERVRNAFGRWTESGYEVRTQRISLPIYSVLHQDLIDGVAAFCASTGIRWFGISIDEDVTNYDEILIERNRSGGYWLHFAVRPKDNRRKTMFVQT